MNTKMIVILHLFCFLNLSAMGINSISNENKNLNEPMVIENESWVTTQVLSEKELKILIEKYQDFKIVKFDSFYGALIKYDHKDKNVIEKLEQLKQEPGIYRVFNKVQEFKNSFEVYTPQ